MALLARVRTTLGAAGIGAMLLVIAYLAGRRGGKKAPASPAAEQGTTPSSFELVKELNAHAGHLATVLALVITATSFSLANGPIRDALVPFNPSAHGQVYGMLVLLGASLALGALVRARGNEPRIAAVHRQ